MTFLTSNAIARRASNRDPVGLAKQFRWASRSVWLSFKMTCHKGFPSFLEIFSTKISMMMMKVPIKWLRRLVQNKFTLSKSLLFDLIQPYSLFSDWQVNTKNQWNRYGFSVKSDKELLLLKFQIVMVDVEDWPHVLSQVRTKNGKFQVAINDWLFRMTFTRFQCNCCSLHPRFQIEKSLLTFFF